MTGYGTDILKSLKRSEESRACIDERKAVGDTGREARKYCRTQYGSRIGNIGRQLGISPQLADRVKANPFDQSKQIRNTPSMGGTVNEFAFGGGSPKPVTSGFNFLYLIPLVLFIPAIRKLIGFK